MDSDKDHEDEINIYVDKPLTWISSISYRFNYLKNTRIKKELSEFV